MADEMEMDDEINATQTIQKDTSKKFLAFLSDELLFGVNAAYVTEIITNHHITMLPMVPNYIKGIINLRGQIIPILDIRLKMNKADMDYTDTSCIIVLDINSVLIGILVDTVSQVVDVYEDKISPPTANNKQELVNGMVSLSSGVVMLLLDCELLINN